MKRCAVSLMLILLLAVMALPTKAQWVVETSLTTVVYQLPRENIVQRFGVLELGRVAWGETSMQVSLPTGLANPGGEFQATVDDPEEVGQQLQPCGAPCGSARMGSNRYRPVLHRLEVHGTTLLTYASCAFAPGGWG